MVERALADSVEACGQDPLGAELAQIETMSSDKLLDQGSAGRASQASSVVRCAWERWTKARLRSASASYLWLGRRTLVRMGKVVGAGKGSKKLRGRPALNNGGEEGGLHTHSRTPREKITVGNEKVFKFEVYLPRSP
jgi:hypothetical protein